MSSSNNVQEIYNTMSYCTLDNVPTLDSTRKWLKERKELVTEIHGGTVGFLDGECIELKVYGVSLKIKLICRDFSSLETIFNLKLKGIVGVENVEVSTSGRVKVQKLIDLIKAGRNDLLNLESFAGNIPHSTIVNFDEPEWYTCVWSDSVRRLVSHMEKGITAVYISLDPSTYALKDILMILAAAVQVDTETYLVISTNWYEPSYRLLLPIVYLIKAINKAKFSTYYVNMLLYGSKHDAIEFLKRVDRLNKEKNNFYDSVIVMGYGTIPRTFYSHSEMDLTTRSGKTNLFVITKCGDVFAAVSSIMRNVWKAGIRINHCARSLAFVHQSQYDEVLLRLKNVIDNINTQEIVSDSPHHSSFVVRTLTADCLEAIQNIKDLGVNVFSKNDDIRGPTLVYNIGCSTDFIVYGSTGLGHVLALIPFRSLKELQGLARPHYIHNLFVYSTNISTVVTALKRMKARKVSLNGSELGRYDFGLSFSLVTFAHQMPPTKIHFLGALMPTRNKIWIDMSPEDKLETLRNFLPTFSSLAYFFMEHFMTQYLNVASMAVPSQSGIVLSNLTSDHVTLILYAIAACLVRGGGVSLIAMNCTIPSIIRERVENYLPQGLVADSWYAENTTQLTPFMKNWDLSWIIHSGFFKLPVEACPFSNENKVMLVTDTQNVNFEGCLRKVLNPHAMVDLHKLED